MVSKIHYEVQRGVYKGRPTLEILKNGEPFWEDLPSAKRRFIFGLKKALLILVCYDVIKEYVDSNGSLYEGKSNMSVSNRKWKIRCEINFHTGFNKNGNWVENPYMEIVGESNISFGLKKAEALVQLRHEIQNFVVDSY